MTCTECKEVIDFESDQRVVVVYSDERKFEEHCHHDPFDEADPAILAILGSQECLEKWWAKQQVVRNMGGGGNGNGKR